MYNSSSVCAVSFQARAICAQKSSTEKHRFIVGTCSLHDNNEISVLQYAEDSNHFDAVAVYSHPDQVWAMDSSPKDSSLLVTSRQSQNNSKSLTVWRMAKQAKEDLEEDAGAYSTETLDLAEVATFNQSQKPALVRSVKWHKTDDKLLSIDNKFLAVWDAESGKQLEVLVVDRDASSSAIDSWDSGCVAWDPHAARQCAAALGPALQLLDTRDMEIAHTVPRAHGGETVRDVDYNPNRPLTLVTAGDDRQVRFWDVRNLAAPVRTLAGHSHWAWCARYNPFHDQLVVSGGGDNLVNLWRIASCSSAPWLSSGSPGGADEGEEDGANDPPDVKVRSMDQHEECVYGAAWSPADAWIYCSLSFDGRAIVNHVPSTEKYKILL